VSTNIQPGIKVVSRVKKAIVVEVVFAAITSEYGLLGKIFSWFGDHKVTIDVVTTSGDSVSFTCDRVPSQSLINKIREEIGEITVWTDKEIIAVIGSNISDTVQYDQIIDLIKSSKPIMLSLNTKQTNLTAIVEEHQGEQLVKDIHKVIVGM
jgi:aspartate kinase